MRFKGCKLSAKESKSTVSSAWTPGYNRGARKLVTGKKFNKAYYASNTNLMSGIDCRSAQSQT